MIGFNPMPDISLGDMEAVMDLGNELNLFNPNITSQNSIPKQIDKDKLIQSFSITIPNIKETQLSSVSLTPDMIGDANEDIDDSLANIDFSEDMSFGDSDTEEGMDEDELGDVPFDSSDIQDDEVNEQSNITEEINDTDSKSNEEPFDDMFGDMDGLEGFDDITEDETDTYNKQEIPEVNKAQQDEFGDTTQPKQRIPLIEQIRQTTVEESQEEIELQLRIQRAREAKQLEEARAERIRKLKEEALLAEKEAELARRKREAEQQRIEEEERLKALRKKEIERQIAENEKAKASMEAERKKKLEDEARARKIKEDLAKLNRIKATAKPSQTVKQTTDQSHTKVAIKENSTPKIVKKSPPSNKYDGLEIDALYEAVKVFLKKHNIERKLIDKKVLEDEFGEQNIHKLIIKSYLISMKKGVTIGR